MWYNEGMESDNKTEKAKPSVHRVLAHSYFTYFLFLLIGVCLDLIFDLKIFNNSFAIPVGFSFLVFGTLLIFWAQKTSRNLKKEGLSKDTFCGGPYRYTRSPTHWGLLFLTLGFGLVVNAFFIVVFSVVSFLITKFTFLIKEEKILAEKYGTPYLEYKKSVRF